VDKRLIEWTCPKCKETVTFPTLAALSLAAKCGGCQGCRAHGTLEKSPGLMNLFLAHWERRKRFPQSSSWTQVLEVVS